MKNYLLYLFLVLTVLLTNCNKKNDTASCTLSSTSIIGRYKVTSITIKNNSNPPVESINTIYAPCQQDDIHEFKATNMYSFIDAGVSCSPSNSIDVANGWSVMGNTLIYFGDAYPVTEFTCAYFKVTHVEIIGALTRVTVTTYTKQ